MSARDAARGTTPSVLEVIRSDDPEVRDLPLEAIVAGQSAGQLLATAAALDAEPEEAQISWLDSS